MKQYFVALLIFLSNPIMAASWYYCASAKTYYPYVASCPEPWMEVDPAHPVIEPAQPLNSIKDASTDAKEVAAAPVDTATSPSQSPLAVDVPDKQSQILSFKEKGKMALNVHNDKAYVEWYSKAAELGDVASQLIVGDMYSGRASLRSTGTEFSVHTDGAEAAKWYRMAAEQGNSNGQEALGQIYEQGFGVVKDKKQALYWYHKAVAGGNKLAKMRLAKYEPVYVLAKAADPSVPGALICRDLDTVSLMIDRYRFSMQDRLQAAFTGAERNQLIHGAPILPPALDKFGCVLVPDGTRMRWNNGLYTPAVVTVKFKNGNTFTGVTNAAMINN